MTRAAVLFDRFMTVIVGLGLIALGMATVAWQRGALGGGRPLQSWAAGHLVDKPWWPWAGGAIGVLVVLVGLRWLIAHGRAPRAKRVGLGACGGASDPALTADAGAVAQAAAVELESRPSIIKASGSAIIERGIPTVAMAVTVPARRGTRDAIGAANEVAQSIAVMLGGAVAVRTTVRVDPKHERIALQ